MTKSGRLSSSCSDSSPPTGYRAPGGHHRRSQPDTERLEVYIDEARSPFPALSDAPRRGISPSQITPFVGREREIVELRHRLERTLAGHGQLILLAGEPGIGKTRLAEEIAAEAEQRDARVLWGHCYEWEGAPAYWPWIQVVRSYLRGCDPQTMRDQLGTDSADIAQLVPEIRDWIPDLPSLPRLDPEQRRFRLFDAVTRFLEYSTEHQPLVIVLDDVHWADEPSLRLLHFITQGIRDASLLIVATYRLADLGHRRELARILADITRERAIQQLVLHGLPKPDVAQFIVRTIEREPPPSLVDAVYQETEGNPFFVTEVVRLLINDGALDPPVQTSAWRIRIPESVRSVVGRRIDRLSRDCRDALSAASVIGRTFSVNMLERLSDVQPVQLLDVLDEAVHAQLVQAEDTLGYYTFSHALVQDTLYQRLGTARRARLHQMAGETIEQFHDNDPSHFAELAYHFFQATPTSDPARAVDYATRAGDHAMAQVAWESAVGHYARALHALELKGTGDQLQRCTLLIALGHAQNRSGPGSGDVAHARVTFEQAAETARKINASEEFARAAVGYAGFNVAATFGGVRQVQLLEEALARLGPRDSILRVQVLSRLAEDLATVSPRELQRVRTLGNDAVETARRLGDPATLAVALTARHVSGYGPDNLRERIADATELTQLAQQADDPYTVTWTGYWGDLLTMLDLVELGDVAGAERAMRAVERVAEQAQIPYITLRAVVYRTLLLLVTGRFAEAEPLIARSRALWQSGGAHQHLFQSFVLYREQGRLAELEGDLRDAILKPPAGINRYSRLHPVLLMVLLLETGREQEARAQFESLAVDAFSHIPFESSWDGVMALLAETCAALGDTDRAELLYDLMLPYDGRNTVMAVNAVCVGWNSLYLGLLATTLSRWVTAETHFRDALSMQERMNVPPYIAHTQYAYALMLAKRDRSDDHGLAIELLQSARDTARSLEMSRLEPKVAELLSTLSRSGGDGNGITPREIEVLRLASQGLTDAEIAQQLRISPRTVNTHMRSLFSKLGVPSRAAATRAAIERDLI